MTLGPIPLPEHVTIVEVGPRDGLQNESQIIATDIKRELVDRLATTGLSYIEATSFVRAGVIPQLADASQVMDSIGRHRGVTYAALAPNLRGYERARESGVGEVAVFTAASEEFNRRNINASIAESIARFEPVVAAAHADGLTVRAYVSTAFGCPYEGEIDPAQVHDVAHRLLGMEVDTLSIGDTIGVAVPNQIGPVVSPIIDAAGDAARIGLHLHDTRGTALSNVWEGLRLGVTTFDSSVAGLGGCPFAEGATGNLATEDLVWFLHRNGVSTGVDLKQLLDVARWISAQLDREPAGHLASGRLWP